ncbi:hypothetical protein KC340_g16783 [Hortaea werneckii]|nr:hypothetical protein KC342_g17383 [Hortaea werneckii]KAI7060133.1 hypothetical protein KC339_g17198 [Hortaea werneckii]KAI7207297.1 hypothetical protein KC365_g16635 [Hortaea werneckii]KAI7292424.1 hypothetical protein KC340_g16783 [Hortaea werneckii]KAI7377025.1 hypothetical protein KC328_g14619 [Hortaea werneckii]
MPAPVTNETLILNEGARVRRNVNQDNHDRWGFAVYRCTCGNCAAWNRFKEIMTTRAQKEIRQVGEPEILKKLELTIFHDRESFDNATKSGNWQREQPRATLPTEAMLLKNPRYRYFIRVGREALDSVLSASGDRDADPGTMATGWVHFVDSMWTAEMDAVDSNTEEFDMPDLDFEPVEGCREADVGWMKVATRDICTELYSLLDDSEM